MGIVRLISEATSNLGAFLLGDHVCGVREERCPSLGRVPARCHLLAICCFWPHSSEGRVQLAAWCSWLSRLARVPQPLEVNNKVSPTTPPAQILVMSWHLACVDQNVHPFTAAVWAAHVLSRFQVLGILNALSIPTAVHRCCLGSRFNIILVRRT